MVRPTMPRRLLLAVLGANVHATLLLVPWSFLPQGDLTGAVGTALVAAPLAMLALGAALASAPLLLCGFPAALLPPLALEPRLVSDHLATPVAFVAFVLGLAAYLGGAAWLLAEPMRPPRATRPLREGRGASARWRRRARLTFAFAALSAALPATLVYAVHFDARNRAWVRELYPGREALVLATLDVGALALAAGVFSSCWVWLLRRHREGDRELTRQLVHLRAEAVQGRARPSFYVSVVGALLFMGLFVALRYR